MDAMFLTGELPNLLMSIFRTSIVNDACCSVQVYGKLFRFKNEIEL
jgi:hypothetical protein